VSDQFGVCVWGGGGSTATDVQGQLDLVVGGAPAMRPWRGPCNANVVAPVSERGKTLSIQPKDGQIR
jgi:hypothetical protein